MDAGIRASRAHSGDENSVHWVREAELNKTPYMLIIGDKESESGMVTPRKRTGQNLPLMDEKGFIGLINEECEQRR